MTNSEQYWNAVGEALEAQMLPDAVKHPAADDGCDKLTETVERARREIEDSLAKSRVRGDPSFLILLTGEEADALLAALTPAGERVALESYEKFDGVGPHAETIETRARIGESYLEAYESALTDPLLTGWHPADCPSELLLDLLERLRTALSRPNVDEGVTQADRTQAVKMLSHLNRKGVFNTPKDAEMIIEAFRSHRVAALNGSGNHG